MYKLCCSSLVCGIAFSCNNWTKRKKKCKTNIFSKDFDLKKLKQIQNTKRNDLNYIQNRLKYDIIKT
jgi:hypothetical protein